jgi:hypothetical protein
MGILDSLYTAGGASSDDVRTRGTGEDGGLQAGGKGDRRHRGGGGMRLAGS